MEVCRACLSKVKELAIMDEEFVKKLNTITGLDVILSEEILYTCETCTNAVNFCIAFREKCISSNKLFQDLLKTRLNLAAIQKNEDEDEIIVKAELKIEYDESKIEYDESKIEYDESKIEYDRTEIEYDYLSDCFDDDNNDTTNEWIKNEMDNINGTKEETKTKKVSKNNKRKLPTKLGVKRNVSTRACKNKDVRETCTKETLRSIPCGLCPKIAKNEDELRSHLAKHKPEMLCGLCPQIFLGLPHMFSHRMTHIPETDRKCHLCNKKMFSEYQIEMHFMRVHEMADKDAPLICKVCSRTFKTVRQISRHMKSHVEGGYKHVCKICSKRFRYPKALACHEYSHAENATFRCDECDFVSKHPYSVEIHKLKLHSTTKVYCDNCRKVFVGKEALSSHLQRGCCKPHSKPRVCNVCGFYSENSSKYSRHMKKHTSEVHRCQLCPKQFKSRSNFNIHMDQHAGVPRYSCKFCQRRFYSASVLVKHRRIHTGEKPYVCEICNKGFTGNHNLKVHMKIHGIFNLIKPKSVDIESTCDK